jgi:hypothetical protein
MILGGLVAKELLGARRLYGRDAGMLAEEFAY